jgi:uncharacterized membrane protein YqjE
MGTPNPNPTPSPTQPVGTAGPHDGVIPAGSGASAGATAGSPGGAAGGPDPRDASMGELFKRLSQDTSQLVKLELQLAKAEMTEKAAPMKAGAGMLGGAALVGLLAAGALTAFLIALLDTFMATWLAALVVTIVYAAIAGFLAIKGRDRIQQATPPVPEQTIETVKEDVEWAKTRGTSATR